VNLYTKKREAPIGGWIPHPEISAPRQHIVEIPTATPCFRGQTIQCDQRECCMEEGNPIW